MSHVNKNVFSSRRNSPSTKGGTKYKSKTNTNENITFVESNRSRSDTSNS